MRRPSILVASFAAAASLLGGALAAAQPIVPAPNQCTVAPRDIAFFQQLVGTPAASPAAADAPAAATPGEIAAFEMPAGEPADRETRVGVLDTVRQVAACLNADNRLAYFALFTDEFFVRQFASDPLGEEDLPFFAATPVPLEGEGRAAILAVVDIRVLPDGRAAALIDFFDPFEAPPGPARFLYVMVEQDGRWLIDEQVNLGPIDEAPVGTPAA